MNVLCEGSVAFLERVYRHDIALFPFTTHVQGGGYESVYAHSRTIRSTVNCLLGMQEARKHNPSHPFLQQVETMTARFLSLHETEIQNLGDLGLLVTLLAESDHDSAETRRVLRTLVQRTSDEGVIRRLNLQDLTWSLWGCIAASQRGFAEAEATAHRLFQVLSTQYHKPGEAIPRHDPSRARGPIVSFGASVYYVHAVYLYGQAFDCGRAMELFRRGATALLSCQRPGGEWPWLLSCRDARPLDIYPVFSVHQHSMAVFFLFPALEEGLSGAEGAISRSLAWVAGNNQLGTPMFQEQPFFIYRSIERKALSARAQRYLRARRQLVTDEAAGFVSNEEVTINRESRSYELGWALYFLSDKPELAGFG